ncbi:hypothetical protein K7432_018493 [Basidiobolus ranarum]|uniref:Uncharacterized protein n=1 Tax=Basidiobolus ranarum TaxID=34480 RepID=A0ABR2WC45_9FUNG
MEHIKDKILFLESAIIHKKYNLIAPLGLLWCKVEDDTYYHIMCYREEEVAYRASKLIPKKNSGKTRMFADGKWTYLDIAYEERIMGLFSQRFDNVNLHISNFPLFGFISVLDNHMRIKVEYMRRGSNKDRRMDRRGRSLTSLKKIDLAVILVLLQTFVNKDDTEFQTHSEKAKSVMWDKLIQTYGSSLDPYIELIKQRQILERIWVTVTNWNAKKIRELIDDTLMISKLYIIL